MTIITTDVCDANEGSDAISVAQPLFRHFGGETRFGGEMVTIHCADDNSRVRELVATPGAGKVLVVDGGGSLRCALLGGNLAVTAANNGWCGILINGCARDVDELRQVKMGVMALAAVPRRSIKRQSGSVNTPVQFAGVVFHPGHFLYADNDGIIVSARAL